jgi:general secretion pathway protein C
VIVQVAMLLGRDGDSERMLALVGKAVCLLAVVWIAWVVAGAAWLASGRDSARLSGGASPAEPSRPTAPPVDVMRLSSLNLFGQAALLSAGPDVDTNSPDTSLQLRLAGVFVSVNSANSSAIVAEQSQPTGKLYRINESLPGGATLESVYEDRILIRRGAGNTEVLRFEKTGLLDGSAGAASASRVSGGATPIATGTPDVRSLLNDASDAMNRSPVSFLQEMGLRASKRGYEVSSDTPEQVRQAAGLQPGDKILSVNGQQLGNLRTDRQILESLKNGGTARVEVQRGGQIVTVERKF